MEMVQFGVERIWWANMLSALEQQLSPHARIWGSGWGRCHPIEPGAPLPPEEPKLGGMRRFAPPSPAAGSQFITFPGAFICSWDSISAEDESVHLCS